MNQNYLLNQLKQTSKEKSSFQLTMYEVYQSNYTHGRSWGKTHKARALSALDNKYFNGA